MGAGDTGGTSHRTRIGSAGGTHIACTAPPPLRQCQPLTPPGYRAPDSEHKNQLPPRIFNMLVCSNGLAFLVLDRRLRCGRIARMLYLVTVFMTELLVASPSCRAHERLYPCRRELAGSSRAFHGFARLAHECPGDLSHHL